MTQEPFRYYKGDVAAIRGERDRARRHQLDCQKLMLRAGKYAADAVYWSGGVLNDALRVCWMPTEYHLCQLASASANLYYVLDIFGSAVETYNRHVDELNDRFEDQRQGLLSDLADVAVDAGTTAESAVRELYLLLEAERQRYEAVVDHVAEWSAAQLSHGAMDDGWQRLALPSLPPTGNVLTYLATGASAAMSTRSLVSAWKTTHGIVRKGKLTALFQYVRTVDPRIGYSFHHRGATSAMEWKQNVVRAMVRRHAVVGAAMPSALFGSYGANVRFFGAISNAAGKAIAPLGVASGGITVYDTWTRRQELDTADEAAGYVYGGASMVSGGLGTAALIVGTAAFPPAGAAVAIGAGAVALGALAYRHRDDIANLATDLGDAIIGRTPDFIDDPTKAGIDAVEDALTYTGDGLQEYFGF